VARKAELIPISRRLERDALRIGEPSVVLGTFQDARYFTAASRRRFDELGLISAFVAAFGAGMPERPLTGVRGGDLAVGDRLRAEWDLVVLGPHYAGALFSRDLGDGGAESDRRFLFAQTEQRRLVVRAARSLMLRMAPLDPSGHPAVALGEAAAARLASVARAALI
jgi:DICT domain-containing protein